MTEVPRSKSAAWQGVVILSKTKANLTVECIYCQHKFTGSVTRVRNHFISLRNNTNRNVKYCTGDAPQSLKDAILAEMVELDKERVAKVKRMKLISNPTLTEEMT